MTAKQRDVSGCLIKRACISSGRSISRLRIINEDLLVYGLDPAFVLHAHFKRSLKPFFLSSSWV